MAHHFEFVIYTSKDLSTLPETLDDLFRIINLSFTQHRDHFETPRFTNAEEFLELLGPDGICAVVRLDTRIVASASAVPWHPDVGGSVYRTLKDERPNDFLLVEQGLSYELKAAVTADAPESRRKGLVERCIGELIARVADRHAGERRLLLWVQVAEDLNGAYWRRRGFEQVGPIEVRLKGSWGSSRDFNFATLVKSVSLRADDGGGFLLAKR
jgi:hypothetical protein